MGRDGLAGLTEIAPESYLGIDRSHHRWWRIDEIPYEKRVTGLTFDEMRATARAICCGDTCKRPGNCKWGDPVRERSKLQQHPELCHYPYHDYEIAWWDQRQYCVECGHRRDYIEELMDFYYPSRHDAAAKV